MNSVKIFEEYIKYYYPIFVHISSLISYTKFCNASECCHCYVEDMCSNYSYQPTLTTAEFSEMKEKYPEFFI